jgi:hypothetical protein
MNRSTNWRTTSTPRRRCGKRESGLLSDGDGPVDNRQGNDELGLKKQLVSKSNDEELFDLRLALKMIMRGGEKGRM